MSGISDRQGKLRLVKALLTHGANVNARMTKRQPSFATGYADATGATPFLLAASVDDVEMMRILLAAGADPKISTATNATAVMAATGLNHGIGESLLTEKDAREAVDFLLNLGLDAKGETTLLIERNTTDAYSDPGNPVLIRNSFGEYVLQTTDNGSKLLADHCRVRGDVAAAVARRHVRPGLG